MWGTQDLPGVAVIAAVNRDSLSSVVEEISVEIQTLDDGEVSHPGKVLGYVD